MMDDREDGRFRGGRCASGEAKILRCAQDDRGRTMIGEQGMDGR